MDTENVVHTYVYTHTHNGILFHHKKECNLAIWDDMDGTEGHNAKWNKSEKDKYCMTSLIHGILKKKKIKLINIENRLVLAWGRVWGVREMSEI